MFNRKVSFILNHCRPASFKLLFVGFHVHDHGLSPSASYKTVKNKIIFQSMFVRLTNAFISPSGIDQSNTSAFDWSLDFWDVLGIVINPCWIDQRINICAGVFDNLISNNTPISRKKIKILLFRNFTNSSILYFLTFS